MFDIAAAAQDALDERFFATTENACVLLARAEGVGREDPVHAELRRALEQLADLERELRARDRTRPFMPAEAVLTDKAA